MPTNRIAVFAACAVLGATASTMLHALPPARSAAPAALRPLSERDKNATDDVGCTGLFQVGRRDFVQLIGTGLTIRDAKGLQKCRLTETDADRLTNGKGQVACGGYRLAVKMTGRTDSSPESDSSATPALLSITRGTTKSSLRGSWGVGC